MRLCAHVCKACQPSSVDLRTRPQCVPAQPCLHSAPYFSCCLGLSLPHSLLPWWHCACVQGLATLGWALVEMDMPPPPAWAYSFVAAARSALPDMSALDLGMLVKALQRYNMSAGLAKVRCQQGLMPWHCWQHLHGGQCSARSVLMLVCRGPTNPPAPLGASTALAGGRLLARCTRPAQRHGAARWSLQRNPGSAAAASGRQRERAHAPPAWRQHQQQAPGIRAGWRPCTPAAS